MGKNQHVVPRSRGWGIRGEGNVRDTGVFRTQREAISIAREIARNQASELVIHGADGRIREKSSYGNHAFPSRG